MPNMRLPLLLVMLLFLAASAALGAASSDPLNVIDRDFRDGRLTIDQKVLLQIQAIKNPNGLPDRYLADLKATADGTLGRCATPALIEIRSNWDLLQPESRQVYSAAFMRTPAETLLVSPSGFFKLHFDTTGANAIPLADSDFSGYPDFVEKCAAYLDSSLDRHIALAYRLPPSDDTLGGDSLYDVYFENTGYYGYTVPEGPSGDPWNAFHSYLVLNNDFLGFDPNYDPEGNQAGAAKATCAHEFHHAVQFAYDAADDTWFMEMDATHFEDLAFDLVDDNYNYLPLFFNAPEKALMEMGDHRYSSFLWGVYLAEKFDTLLMPAIWEGARYQTTFAAMRDTLMSRHGWTLDSAFAEFAAWNYLTTTRYDSQHYLENYPYSVKIGSSHSFYPVTLLSSPYNPAGYGACYLQFFPGSTIGKLQITVNGDDARQWQAYLIKSTAQNVHTFEKIVLAPGSFYGLIEVPQMENYYRFTVVMVNTMEYSTGAFFSYSAQVIPPYEVSSSVVTVDSAVYSGGYRNFKYLISNDAPIVDILDVTAWDDVHWIFRDTLSYSLAPHSDSLVNIAVVTPTGTPLGTLSNMWFKVTSRGNPAMVDSQAVIAKTVLQRGDANFSGSISVADLTYLVNYLFKSGASPQPILASGDFTCEGSVNVGDLTLLVRYLFQGGSPCVCNPY